MGKYLLSGENFIEDEARKFCRLSAARHLNLNHLLADHFCKPENERKINRCADKIQNYWLLCSRILIKIFPIIFVICLSLTSCEDYVQINLNRQGDYYVHSYTWAYRNRVYQMDVSIPVATYNHYASLPFEPIEKYDTYVYEDPDFPYLEAVDKSLYDLVKREHLNHYELAQFVLSFVQAMPYGRHVVIFFDKPRSPAVILAQGGPKDCKDGSIMAASLLSKMGYKTSLIFLPLHMALGISGLPKAQSFFLQDKVPYAYAETTSYWPIGEIPDEMKGKQIQLVIPIAERPSFHLNKYSAQSTYSAKPNVAHRTSCQHTNSESTTHADQCNNNAILTSKRIHHVIHYKATVNNYLKIFSIKSKSTVYGNQV